MKIFVKAYGAALSLRSFIKTKGEIILMKKILSIILTVAMLMSLSVAAFAADINSGGESGESGGQSGGDYTLGVSGVYVGGASASETISVDISWQSMQFTYTVASNGTWNPATHLYEGATQGGWSTNQSTITLTNHSNVDIGATFTFAAAAAATGVKGKFTSSTISIESADADKYRTPDPETGICPAPVGSTQFGIDPTSAAITQAYSVLGTITVRIKRLQSERDLRTVLETIKTAGGTVTLENDITLASTLTLTDCGTSASPLTIDLGGHTIYGNVAVSGSSNVKLQNGKIVFCDSTSEWKTTLTDPLDLCAIGISGASVNAELADLEIEADGDAVTLYKVNMRGDILIKDCKFVASATYCAQTDITMVLPCDSYHTTFEGTVWVSNYIFVRRTPGGVTLTNGGEYHLNYEGDKDTITVSSDSFIDKDTHPDYFKSE